MYDEYYPDTARWQSAAAATDAWGFISPEALRACVAPYSRRIAGEREIYDIQATYEALCVSVHPIAEAVRISRHLSARGKGILARFLRDAIRERTVHGLPEIVDHNGMTPSVARNLRHREARARRIVDLVATYPKTVPGEARDVHYCLRLVHPSTNLADYRSVAHIAANIRSAKAKELRQLRKTVRL